MIIKCPECGHQVSERAPICPHCGVEIQGKITRCRHCGEIYFVVDGVCPSCHQTNAAGAVPQAPPQPQPAVTTEAPQPKVQPQHPTFAPVTDYSQSPKAEPEATSVSGQTIQQPVQPQKDRGGRRTALIASVIIALVVFATFFYFYQQSQREKETDEYEFAMRSNDEEVLKNYLARYADASEAHRDSIMNRLTALQKGDEEWQNAVLSNSRAALQRYLDQNPESVHAQEAMNKIDSLDWVAAQRANTLDALESYMTQHPEGRYADEASIQADKLRLTTVQPAERDMITSAFRQFFQSINSRDEDRLANTVSMVISEFLGKANATSSDVITFLHKIYKEDISNMNWRIDTSSYKITKTPEADDEYSYDVTFSASQDIEREGGSEQNTYRISATVTSDGKICKFNMTKLQ